MNVRVTVDLKELAFDIPTAKFVQVYTKPEVLGCFTVSEIVSMLDNDSLLEAIGEEKIRDFLGESQKEVAV